ncbi:MAG TPA: hypothetical protein GXZ96_00300 [Firmicutes bacterium]|jgi:hypothetical protein|nr:hypothetical protein [Bacillota bacterium]
MTVTSTFVALGIGFLAGYLCGKATGSKCGYALGQAESPIILRHRGLEEGVCPICGNPAADGPAGLWYNTRELTGQEVMARGLAGVVCDHEK